MSAAVQTHLLAPENPYRARRAGPGLTFVRLDLEDVRALYALGLRGDEILLYGVLRAHQSEATGLAYPRQSTLARELGRPLRTVKRWLARLIEVGLVAVQQTGRGALYSFPVTVLPLADQPGEERPTRCAKPGPSHREGEGNDKETEVVSTAPPPAPPSAAPDKPPTTRLSGGGEEEPTPAPPATVPDRDEIRTETREAKRIATEWGRASERWRFAHPDADLPAAIAEPRDQARARVTWLQTQARWLREAEEAWRLVRLVPGFGDGRGDGGVSGLEAVWGLRLLHAAMGDGWLTSVRKWVARHAGGDGRLGSLAGWLARERVPELARVPEPVGAVEGPPTDLLPEEPGPATETRERAAETPWQRVLEAARELPGWATLAEGLWTAEPVLEDGTLVVPAPTVYLARLADRALADREGAVAVGQAVEAAFGRELPVRVRVGE